jgi:hypothetical protein
MAYRSSTTATGSSITATGAAPAGVAAGDRLYARVVADGVRTITPPAPWVSLGKMTVPNGAPDGHTDELFEIKSTDGTESYAFAMDITNFWCVQVIAITGRHATNAALVTPTQNNVSQATPITIGLGGVTALAGDDLLFLPALNQLVGADNWGFSVVTNFTERHDDTGISWLTVGTQTRDNVTAGATGTLTTTGTRSSGTGNATWTGFVVGVPAAAATIINSSAAQGLKPEGSNSQTPIKIYSILSAASPINGSSYLKNSIESIVQAVPPQQSSVPRIVNTWAFSQVSGAIERVDSSPGNNQSVTVQTRDNIAAGVTGTLTTIASRVTGSGDAGWTGFIIAIPSSSLVVVNSSASQSLEPRLALSPVHVSFSQALTASPPNFSSDRLAITAGSGRSAVSPINQGTHQKTSLFEIAQSNNLVNVSAQVKLSFSGASQALSAAASSTYSMIVVGVTNSSAAQFIRAFSGIEYEKVGASSVESSSLAIQAITQIKRAFHDAVMQLAEGNVVDTFKRAFFGLESFLKEPGTVEVEKFAENQTLQVITLHNGSIFENLTVTVISSADQSLRVIGSTSSGISLSVADLVQKAGFLQATESQKIVFEDVLQKINVSVITGQQVFVGFPGIPPDASCPTAPDYPVFILCGGENRFEFEVDALKDDLTRRGLLN